MSVAPLGDPRAGPSCRGTPDPGGARHRGRGAATRSRPARSRGRATSPSCCAADGAVILVGERLAGVPGALSAALRLAASHRRPAGLGPAPGRRARRARGRRAARRCCPVAARSPTPRPASTSPRPGASTDLPGRAGPRHRRDPRRGRAPGELGGAASSAASTRPTCPTRQAALRGARRGRFVVSLELRAQRGHRARRRRAAGRRRRRRRRGTFVDWEGRAAAVRRGARLATR